MTLRTAWDGANAAVRVATVLAAILALVVVAWLVLWGWNDWQRGRTAKAVNKVETKTAAAQSGLDDQVHQKEVETIIREPIIINRTIEQASRIREAPAGRQLVPTLDALCLSRLYEADPICASRVQSAGAGEEAVRRRAPPKD